METKTTTLILQEAPMQLGSYSIENLDEIEEGVRASIDKYKAVVFTQDNIGDAKEVGSQLNKLKDRIATKRKDIAREFNSPIEETLKRLSQLEKEIDEVSKIVHKQVNDITTSLKTAETNEITRNYSITISLSDKQYLKLTKYLDKEGYDYSIKEKKGK